MSYGKRAGRVYFDESQELLIGRGQNKSMLFPSLYQSIRYFSDDRIKRWKAVFTMSMMKGIVNNEDPQSKML